MDIHNPDDQLASLKAWWQQYGTALIAGVVIGLLLLGGLNYWKQYRAQRAEAASVLYEKLLDSLQQGRNDEAGKTAATLVADYAATPYAGKAALLAARLRFEEQDLAGARQQLEWAVENAREAAVQRKRWAGGRSEFRPAASCAQRRLRNSRRKVWIRWATS